jgi:hypothetical protein
MNCFTSQRGWLIHSRAKKLMFNLKLDGANFNILSMPSGHCALYGVVSCLAIPK